jgi:hypothetical protein
MMTEAGRSQSQIRGGVGALSLPGRSRGGGESEPQSEGDALSDGDRRRETSPNQRGMELREVRSIQVNE